MMGKLSSRRSNFSLIVVLATILLASCSGDENGGIVGPPPEYWAGLYDWSDSATWTDPATWPDNKLLSFVYSGQSGPPGFYREDYGRGSPYYENTVSVRKQSGQWIDMCTTDRDSAYAWSEASAVNGAYYRELDSELETEKYFEFRRVYNVNPVDVILSRVHKCSYLDRSMFDRLNPSEVLGVFGVRSMTAELVCELVEYMWTNSMISEFGRPLSSDTNETQTSYVQTIYFVHLVGGDFGTCDSVHFQVALVEVDKATGAVTFESTELREFAGVCYE